MAYTILDMDGRLGQWKYCYSGALEGSASQVSDRESEEETSKELVILGVG